ncbi:MAG: hypothetical protein GWN18_11395, partial [Thermoplasmata archaeon]|nr:hypothetical protein [Thermoplasmata archaeon]NIS12643.1 hypothetical protein [Thermoplasmata archaeon]NIS20563.1 hypothetical protein [Thermoplasmata archaeon]NIT77942.1 hypothetical protein [Thermoplasmata archaeon]NIU49648.1 hypothetical protein [Thermoplasmata archaeon]
MTGQTLSKTYTMNGTLKFLYLYVYSSDSDTLTINIEGYNDDTGSWERIYYQNSYSPGTGVRVNNWFTDKNYTSWRISYRDYENNDRIYYNCTYVDDAVGDGATIPPAGTQDMVYYRFNVTDAAYNYLVTDIYEYPIDSTAPTIVNHSIPSVLQRKVAPIPVYANLTDAVYLRSAHLNYSLDNTTWFRVPMTKLSGNTTIGQFRGYLPYPVPSTNTTYYVRVEGYDYPYNLGKTAIHTFGWNPPPWIDTIRLDPEHANNQSYVNITARVTDVDGVDRVYIRYLDGGTIWTRVNAT